MRWLSLLRSTDILSESISSIMSWEVSLFCQLYQNSFLIWSFNPLGYLLQPRSIRSTRHLRSRDSLPQWCCRESVTDSHSRREGEKRTERRRLPTPKSSLRESRSRKSENWREDDHQDLLACLSPAHKLHLLLKSSTSFIVINGSICLMIIK